LRYGSWMLCIVLQLIGIEMGFTFGENWGMFGECVRNCPHKHNIVSALHGKDVRQGANAKKIWTCTH
jgi:hypothetical protein